MQVIRRCLLSAITETIDCVVIGAGAIGLTIARELAQQQRVVLVLEQSGQIGTGVSSRNSEVIHGGLYYKKDSLKAALCVEGKRMLYEYLKEKNIPHKQCGKLIIATHRNHITTLSEITAQARENGVNDVELLDATDTRLLEPHVRCVGACLSPSTGILDSHQFMNAIHADAEAAGAIFSFRSRVVGGDVSQPVKELIVEDMKTNHQTKIHAYNIINAAGLYAWDVAQSLSGYSVQYLPKRFFARGCYFAMKGRAPFTRLIYPVPEQGGLGIHLTIDLQGKAKFGPDVEWVDEIDFTVDPKRVSHFYDAIRTYYPDLPDDSLQPDYAGIRPKNTGPEEPASDFLIQTHQSHVILGLIHLFGIESPGLTASMAIAQYVAEILDG